MFTEKTAINVKAYMEKNKKGRYVKLSNGAVYEWSNVAHGNLHLVRIYECISLHVCE